MRLAILSNVTTSVLEGMLRKEHRIWSPSGFGAWVETALNPPQDLVDFQPETIYLLLENHFREEGGDCLEAACVALRRFFPNVPIVVPNLKCLAGDFGEHFYDAGMWKIAKMPWSLKGLRELKKIFGIKKVLAVDLDNTLWDGVLGEDGQKGIIPRVELQEQIKALKDEKEEMNNKALSVDDRLNAIRKKKLDNGGSQGT